MIWPTKKLGEVLELCDSGTWGGESPDGMPLLRSTNMQNGELVLGDLKYIDIPSDEIDRYKLREGDILITKSSGSVDHIGKSLYITNDMDGKYGFSNFTQRLRANQKVVLPKWIYLKISNLATREFLLGASQTTTGLRNLKISVLKELEIPLPPIGEQRKIVAKLERLLGKIKEAKRLRSEAEESTQNLLSAELHKIFERGKKEEWGIRSFNELFDITSSKRVFKSEWTNQGIPFYRAREIVKMAKGQAFKNPIFVSEEMYEKYKEKYGVPKDGDILVTGVGTLGITYRVKDNDRFYFKDGNIIWLKKKFDVNSEFVDYFFKSDIMREQIDANAGGATVRTFTIKTANRIQIPLPPLAEQKKIVARLDSLSEKIKKLQEYQKSTAVDFIALEQSILHKAFAGELI